MSSTVTLCTGTCIWVFDGTNWEVKSSTCTGGCGCFDSTSTATFAMKDSKAQVPHATFLDGFDRMMKDPHLLTLPDGPRLKAQLRPTTPNPKDEVETACMT